MTREEAIQWLKHISTREFGWDEYAMQDSQKEIRERCEQCIRDAIDLAITTLSAEAEWIPCSERLPEVGEICLLTVHEYGWNCKDYTRVIIGEYSDNYADHILAWMPLPKPYREDGEV